MIRPLRKLDGHDAEPYSGGKKKDHSTKAIWLQQFGGRERLKMWGVDMLDQVARGSSQGTESIVIIIVVVVNIILIVVI